MTITVNRYDKNDHRCIGRLNMPGFECYTLEDACREQKIMHKSAIPSGTYEMVISYSNRFNKMLPLLLDVPGFSGVRVHSGSTERDTSGCLLLGMNRTFDTISESRSAVVQFMTILMKYVKKEKVYIEIT